MTAQDPPGVKSADRALAVLEFVGAQNAATFSSILAALDLPKSSGHVLIRSLVHGGWLRLDSATRRYTLGVRVWQLGRRYDALDGLLAAARPVMDRLAESCGETVQLAVLDGLENVYIAISESTSPMRIVSSVGMRLPAHATGLGARLLAALDPEEARRRLAGARLEAYTPRTLVDPESVLLKLEATRATGFAVDDEEYVAGCRCVAVLVGTEAEAGFVSALSITAPTARTTSAWPVDFAKPLEEAADLIRIRLGALGGRPGLAV